MASSRLKPVSLPHLRQELLKTRLFPPPPALHVKRSRWFLATGHGWMNSLSTLALPALRSFSRWAPSPARPPETTDDQRQPRNVSPNTQRKSIAPSGVYSTLSLSPRRQPAAPTAARRPSTAGAPGGAGPRRRCRPAPWQTTAPSRHRGCQPGGARAVTAPPALTAASRPGRLRGGWGAAEGRPALREGAGGGRCCPPQPALRARVALTRSVAVDRETCISYTEVIHSTLRKARLHGGAFLASLSVRYKSPSLFARLTVPMNTFNSAFTQGTGIRKV